MSELAEAYREIKTVEAIRRRTRLQQNTEILQKLNMPYIEHSPYHFLVKERFNFWPSTGRWHDKVTKRVGKGIEKMFEFMDKEGV